MALENGSVEILLNCICENCSIVSINGTADLFSVSKRENFVSGDCISPEAAIRPAGNYVYDEENEDSPCAIVVCQAICIRSFSNETDAQWRITRRFGMRTLQYLKTLKRETMTVGDLLGKIYVH